MAEGTQLRGPSCEVRWLRWTGRSNLYTTRRNRPAQGLVLCPGAFSSLKTLVCTPLARSKIIFRTSELRSGTLAELDSRICIWNWLQLDAIVQDSLLPQYRSSACPNQLTSSAALTHCSLKHSSKPRQLASH